MPRHVLIIDFFCVIAAVTGFTMAFRQALVRRLLGRPATPASSGGDAEAGGDPVTYVLRISGVMMMVFGVAIGGMMTLFNLL